MRHILSCSGGKDSTYMVLRAVREGWDIAAIVHYDWGKEFPEMAEHLARLEAIIGRHIISLQPTYTWEWEMLKCPLVYQNGQRKGQLRRIGRGWPSPRRPWCRRNKATQLERFYKANWPNALDCIGFAADEEHRVDRRSRRRQAHRSRYPLIEWGVTEADALAECRAAGFDWGGLYDVFDRVSCYLCNLGGLTKARLLRKHRPKLWQEILKLDAKVPPPNIGFDHYATAHDLERRFQDEDRRREFPAMKGASRE